MVKTTFSSFFLSDVPQLLTGQQSGGGLQVLQSQLLILPNFILVQGILLPNYLLRIKKKKKD